jgi:hypothetical protein
VFSPAPHAPLPQLSGHSKTVLSSARLLTVTYAGDAMRGPLEMYGSLVLGSQWFIAVGNEYGVRNGAAAGMVELGAAPALLTHDEIESTILQLATTPAQPHVVSTSPGQQLYVLYVPAGVAIGAGLTGQDYHATILVGTIAVPYAVVFERASLFDTTAAAGRALINTATDPYSVPDDGYYADPPVTDPWSLAHSEAADLCAGDPALALDATHPQFAAPRVYSSLRASGDEPPCAPIGDDDPWSEVSAEPTQIQMVAPGDDVAFRLTGWSATPIADWTLQLAPAAHSQLSTDEMAPALDHMTINNDGTATLTLHAPIDATSGQLGGVYVLSGPSGHPWLVGIVVK